MLNQGTPVTPRAAATILVIEGTGPGWRVLMMRRPGSAEFAPGAYVFPGGSLHAEDEAFGDASRAAGVRELFEEVGLLLARHADGRSARDGECRSLRALLADGTGWSEALSGLGLAPALDRLTFLARWITPEAVARRFDTRFYLSRRPAGQTVHPQPDEVSDWIWTRPVDALAPGGPTLVHATRRILQSVADEPDPSRLIARLRRRRETPPVMPRVVRRPDGTFEVLDETAPEG
jgi:8-oxo-dGTP pyrophosphatase MutT (NUDIX family)